MGRKLAKQGCSKPSKLSAVEMNQALHHIQESRFMMLLMARQPPKLMSKLEPERTQIHPCTRNPEIRTAFCWPTRPPVAVLVAKTRESALPLAINREVTMVDSVSYISSQLRD